MIRLLLIDDHETLRTSLALLLDLEPDMAVTGQAGTISAALELDFDVDVLLLDLDLPDGNGADLIPELRARNPEAATIVLTGSTDRYDYASAIEEGAAGAIHKASSIDEVLTAIRKVANRQSIHSPEEISEFIRLTVRQRVRATELDHLVRELTPREYDLLHALADGLSDREIADRLHLSVRTVQSHMQNLMDKFNVHSRLQALTTAVRHGLIQIPRG